MSVLVVYYANKRDFDVEKERQKRFLSSEEKERRRRKGERCVLPV
jgi:hypothetical protein